MVNKVLRAGLIMALAGGLFAQALFNGTAVAQKKSEIFWDPPVKITRVKKPNRQPPARPAPATQVTALLNLQWHLIKRGDSDKTLREEVDPNREFVSGDQLKLAITTNQNGYLYIVTQTEGADGAVLFPDPRLNGGSNFVKKNQQYIVPAFCKGVEELTDPEDCWFTMAPPAGRETLIVIFSRDKITTLPSEVTTAGSVIKPEVISELKASSEQKVEQWSGRLKIPGQAEVRYATRVANLNRKDNEELIATIELKHGE